MAGGAIYIYIYQQHQGCKPPMVESMHVDKGNEGFSSLNLNGQNI